MLRTVGASVNISRMSAPSRSASLRDQIHRIAAQQTAQFRRRNVRARRRGTVHAAGRQRWLGDEELVVPACHIGTAGFDLAALSPTSEPVTCQRPGCKDVDHHGPVQLALWDDPDPGTQEQPPPARTRRSKRRGL